MNVSRTRRLFASTRIDHEVSMKPRLCLESMVATAALSIAAAASAAPAATGLLHSFDQARDHASEPGSGLTLASDGYFYGTTSGDAPKNDEYGAIYAITPTGDYRTIHVMHGDDPVGIYPIGGLSHGSDGELYGATVGGGAGNAGAIFRIAPDGRATLLHAFYGSDGRIPQQPPIPGPGGDLYGTTKYGGTFDLGTVYRMAPDGSRFTTLHFFSGTNGDGMRPSTGLVVGPGDTGLCGTTTDGGVGGLGTVFCVTPAGAMSTLHAFAGGHADGSFPDADLIVASDGNFYGTTYYGGGYACTPEQMGCGTVFRLSAVGRFELLHRFGPDHGGQHPSAPLVEASDGNLYGTTTEGGAFNTSACNRGCGVVFALRPREGRLTTVHSFGVDDGWQPSSGLIEGADSTLFGTTRLGGESGQGTVYEIFQQASPTGR